MSRSEGFRVEDIVLSAGVMLDFMLVALVSGLDPDDWLPGLLRTANNRYTWDLLLELAPDDWRVCRLELPLERRTHA